MSLSPEFRALNREVALAKSAVCSGLTALRRANHAASGVYTDAFFGLSIGFERFGKLAFVIDHCLSHNGQFPTDKQLRALGHDLNKLWQNSIALRTKYSTEDALAQVPQEQIVTALIRVLSDFARGARYYNLDLLVGGSTSSSTDPITRFNSDVLSPILEKHRKPALKAKHETRADLMEAIMGSFTCVRHEAADGRPLHSVGDAAAYGIAEQYALKWAQFYALCITRFWSLLLIDLSYEGIKRHFESIPFISDHLGMFVNEDAYLKSRKTWGAA